MLNSAADILMLLREQTHRRPPGTEAGFPPSVFLFHFIPQSLARLHWCIQKQKFLSRVV
jgi:hypothetical protein